MKTGVRIKNTSFQVYYYGLNTLLRDARNATLENGSGLEIATILVTSKPIHLAGYLTCGGPQT